MKKHKLPELSSFQITTVSNCLQNTVIVEQSQQLEVLLQNLIRLVVSLG